MLVTDEQYSNHQVFSDLAFFVDLYDELARSVFSFTTAGTHALGNIDSYVFSSMQGTLDSISVLLKLGRVNDAYALLRKFYDSAVLNIYSILYLKDNFSIEKLIVAEISDWLRCKGTLPEYRVMAPYIRKSSAASFVTQIIDFDGRYGKLRERCNDHTHYNYFSNVLLNDKDLYLRGRVKEVDSLQCDIRDIVIYHLAYLFFVNQHYMMATDHLDYLDCGMTPPQDSQYWVAPIVQQFFDSVLSKYRPDLATVIKSHTCMQLQ